MRGHPERLLPWALLVVTGLSAAVGGALGWQQGRQPGAFEQALSDDGHFTPTHSGPLVVGATTWFGLTYPGASIPLQRDDGERARLREAEPRVLVNTAQAEVELLVCVIDPAAGVGAVGSLSSQRDLDATCRETLPVGARPLRLSGGFADQVVLRLTPTREGVVQVDGADVTYSYAGRTGTEHVGLGVQLGDG